jgi:hypothetical protein
MKKYVLNIICCLLISLCCGLILLQQSSYVKDRVVGQLVTLLEKEWDSKITIENKLLNLFTASIVLEGGKVVPAKQPHTTWGFEQAKVSFSLWDLIFKKKASLYISLYKVNGDTVTCAGGIEIIDHLVDILSQKSNDFAVSIKKVLVSRGTIKVHHDNLTFDLNINGAFTFDKIIKDNIKTQQGCVLLDNSSVFLNGSPLLEGISGSNIFYREKGEEFWHITLHNTIKTIANEAPYHHIFTGSWYQQDQTFLLQETTQKLTLKATTSNNSLLHLEGNMPVRIAAQIYDLVKKPATRITPAVEGQCLVDLTLSKHLASSWLCQGLLALDHPRFKELTCESLILKNIFINQDIASADLNAIYNPTYSVQGSAHWNQNTQEGNISLANSREIITAHRPNSPIYWSIQPQQANLALHINDKLQLQGTYAALFHNSINEETKEIKGRLSTNQEFFSINGTSQAYSYSINGSLGESPHLTKITCREQKKQSPVIDFTIQNDQTKTLQGFVEYGFIQQLLPANLKNKILGKHNKIFASLKQDKLAPLEGELWTENSKFFIPSVQNMIKSGHLQFHIEPATKKLTFNDIAINFARGNIKVPLASCELNQETWAIQNLYAPISVNNLLINLKRDFYSFVYGNLLLQQHLEKPLNLSGTLVLNKTLVRGDVFSDSQASQTNPLDQLQELNNEFDFSIRLINEKPIIIKTPTIEALAHVDLQTTFKQNPTTAQLPHVTGTINLDAGHLKFLENNLKIEYGKIQFLTRQLNDPVIDLIAKNRINKYIVTLQVTGSLQKPTVILESTPELGEEQILGLLFTGSENATLQTDLPVMIMQNLNTILLGHRKPYDKTSILLDTLSKPLKYVQITPDFTDQNGRSSVRALVSVPLGKQLKAQFQKNLTFDEDLGVEIDYLLSDDINLKLVKDQRGELGSEVEVRFKF